VTDKPVGPPGGASPPARATLPDGVVLDLHELATEISAIHLARHPEDLARYGAVGRAWCIHDNQHLLNWAVLDVCEALDFGAHVAWLADVLGSRGYPLANLADDLQTASHVVRRRLESAYAETLAEVLAIGIRFIETP
jgi:hypothetical protein